MLTNLLIKNYALIRHLEMQPAAGLNIITGETGAGKSIILGAVGLLLGKRADTKMLLNQELKCIVEGTFTISSYFLEDLFEQNHWEYHPQTIIRREINTNGKSRAFINDSPVTLDGLKTLGTQLLDVHSQNDSLKLGGQHFQRDVLDIFGQHRTLVEEYQQQFNKWSQLKEESHQLISESKQRQQEADYKNFLLKELEAVSLDTVAQEQLESSLKVMEHAEEIKINLQGCLQLLEVGEFNVEEQLAAAIQMLNKIQQYALPYDALKERLESTLIEIKDIANELQDLDDRIEHNPKQIQELQSQLDGIYRLQNKHSVDSVEALIEIRDQLDKESNKLEYLEQSIQELQVKINKAETGMIALGTELQARRKDTFPHFKQCMEDLLNKLGMEKSNLQCSFENTSPGPFGLERIQWLFSANKGVEPQPLKKVASGGEFSRLMFCVKYLIADKVSLPTIIFDEIDTGISGEVALQMIDMMQEMARNHQVVTISHLPQFAAKGDHHYYVYKESDSITTSSGIKKLTNQERLEEIAKMLGGNNPSDIALANARELMGAEE